MGILDVNSDRTKHVDNAKPAAFVRYGRAPTSLRGGNNVRERQGRRNREDGQIHGRPVCTGYRQYGTASRSGIEVQDILRVNAPPRTKPRTSRVKATRNWLPFPMVGTKGEPAAACQTSCSEESMCWELRLQIVLRARREMAAWKADGKERRRPRVGDDCLQRKCQLDSFRFPCRLSMEAAWQRTGESCSPQMLGSGSALQQPGGDGSTFLRILSSNL